MDNAEIRDAFIALQERAVVAQGDALFAGLLIGPLLKLLVDNGTLNSEEARTLIDGALLVLERRRHSMNAPDQAVIDHARNRLEFQLKFLKQPPPSTPSA